jgi:hypothetical protein
MANNLAPPTPAPRRSLSWLGLVLGCVGLFVCGLAVVVAAGSFWFLRSRAQTTTPTVEYILDASPRMTQASEGGTRLSIAQAVLAEIVRPADTAVTAGLRVFGTGHQPAVCQDTDLLVPLTPASQGLISDRLAALTGGAGADAALADAMVAAIRDLAAKPGLHSLVVVTGGADSCNPEAGQLIAREAGKAGIKLELFVVAFQVSDEDAAAIKGVVDQTSGATYLSAADADELRQTLAAIQAHVDHPTTTTVAGVVATAGSAGPLPTAPAGATPSGPTGTLSLSVLAYAGQPAEADGRLIVEAFAPQDHEHPLTGDYINPAVLQLPTGSYDIRMMYGSALSSHYTGGTTAQWLEAVPVVAGEMTSRTYDLKLGEVNLAILEAAGKPIVDMPISFAFRVYPQGGRKIEAAWIIVTSTATLQLPGGFYDVVVDFPNTYLAKQDQPAQTFEVKPGQSSAVAVNLKLGHLRIEVDDEAGQPIEASSISALAYPADQPDQEFAYVYGANPVDLPLRAGVTYTIRIVLDGGQELILSDQQVQEGEVQQVKVNRRDFK